MKSTLSLFKSPLVCAGLVLAAAVSSAIAGGSKSVSYSSNFGNTNVGYASSYTISAANSATGASLAGTATSSATLLGVSKPLATFAVTNKLVGSVPTANMSLVFASYIVSSETDSATTTWSKTSGQTFATTSTTVNVPTGSVTIPVSIAGTLAGSGSIAMTASLSKTAVGLSGNIGTNVAGTAAATVDSKYNAKVTLTSNLNYGKAQLNANSSTASATAMSGNFTLGLDAASLSFIVQLNATTAKAALLGATTLGSFVLPARTFSLLSL